MRVEYLRSGGFAGLQLTTVVDTEQLVADEASNLEKMVNECDFFAQPGQIRAAGPSGADRFEYRLTVTMETRSHTVVVGEAALPDTFRPLIDYLTAYAKTSGKR